MCQQLAPSAGSFNGGLHWLAKQYSHTQAEPWSESEGLPPESENPSFIQEELLSHVRDADFPTM